MAMNERRFMPRTKQWTCHVVDRGRAPRFGCARGAQYDIAIMPHEGCVSEVPCFQGPSAP